MSDYTGMEAVLADALARSDEDAVKAAILALVFGALKDLSRIADALDMLSATEANRVTR